MGEPKLLLLDEPSLGLSPICREVFDALRRLRDERGLAMLIVEQDAALSLSIADRAYVLEAGEFVSSGSAAALIADETIRRSYLGL